MIKNIHTNTKYLLKIIPHLFLLLFCDLTYAADINITGDQTTAANFTENNQAINVTGDLSLTSNSAALGYGSTKYTGNIVTVNSGDISKGIRNTNSGSSASAILIDGIGQLSTLTLTTGLITSAGSAATVAISDTVSATTNITVGQASGVAATISNSSSGDAINVSSSQPVVNLTVNNTGIITGTTRIGSNNSSSVTLNGGTTGNIVMGSQTQSLVLNGGTVDGSIQKGAITVTADTIVNGDIGLSSASGSLVVSDGASLYANYQNLNSYQAIFLDTGKNITLGIGSTLSANGEIHSGGDAGSITGALGSTLNINNGFIYATGGINVTTLNLGNSSSSDTGSFFSPITATTINITGASSFISSTSATNINISDSSTLNLASTSTTNGNINLGNDSTLNYQSSASVVNGTINGNGILNVSSSVSSSVVTNGDIGNTSALQSVTIASGKTLNLSTNDNSLSLASNSGCTIGSTINSCHVISLASGSSLIIGSKSVVAEIGGFGSGAATVSFTADNSLAGNVGHLTYDNDGNLSGFSSIGSVTISSGKTLSAGSYGINSQNITLGSGATLSTSGNVRGGSSSSATITLGSGATLLLNSGAALNGTVNGYGYLNLGSNFNLVTNNNIGSSTALHSLSLGSGSTLNLATNNNSVAADSIILGSNSSVMVGSATVAANIIGTNNADSVSFLDNNSLAGNLGDASSANKSINSVSIASSKTLAASTYEINSSSITINSSSTLSSSGIIRGESGANTSISLGNLSTLALGNGATVTAAIDGATNLNGSTVSTTGTVNFSSSSIGATHAINYLTINDSSNASFSSSINSNSISLGSGSILTLNDGASVTSTIDGTANSNGSIVTSGAVSFSSSSLGVTHALNNLTINASSNASFASSVNVNSISLASNSTLTLNNGASVASTINGGGSIVTSGAVNLSNSTIGNSSSLNSLTINSGSTVTFGSNNLSADTFTINGSALFNASESISGNLSVNNGATVNVAGNTVTLNNDFTVNSGSTLAFTINGNSAGSILVSGIASLSANTNINLTISGSLTSGNSYTLISGATGSTINTVENDKINVNGSGNNLYGSLTLSSLVSGNDFIIEVTGANSPTENFSNPNDQNTYNTIVNIPSATAQLAIVQNYLLSNDVSTSQKESALDSVTTQIDNSSNRIVFNNLNTTLDLVSTRLHSFYDNNNQISGISSGDSTANGNKSLWGEIFGSNAKQGNTGTSNGYNANIRGLEIGYDKQFSDNLIAGVAGSYSSSNIKSIDALKQTGINSYQANIYSRYRCHNCFTDLLLGFVWNDYKSTRNIPVAGATAKSNYTGQSYVARIESGFNKTLENNFVLSPSLAFTAANNSISNYSEDGAGTLNLRVNNKSINFFEVRPKVALSNKFFLRNDLVAIPEIFVSYGYDFAGSKQKTSSNFIGQTAVIDSSANNIAKGSFKTGFGVKFYGDDSLSLIANYTYENRSNYHSNSGSLKLVHKF